MIYLDHAATTPLRREALEAMLPFLCEQYGNPSSSYAAARSARQAVDRARGQVAKLIRASAQEVYFTSGGTESDNWALFGVMHALKPEKKHVIVSSIEHHAILRCCEALEEEGFLITYAPVDKNGVVDVEAIRSAVSPQTALISVMLANNEVGTVQPIKEIADIAHECGALMHTDGVQAVGHIPVNAEQLGVDLLSMSAHKFYGPKGVGALFIRKGLRLDRLIHGGEQEKGMRAGTENVPGIVGMGMAAQLALEEMEAERERISGLRDTLAEEVVKRIPNVKINALDAERLPGHVHMTIDRSNSDIVLMQLDMMGIAASSGSACASGASTRSHVMTAMGITGKDQADLRISLGRSNTEEDIQKIIDALVRICPR